jgi:hypothetical protein
VAIDLAEELRLAGLSPDAIEQLVERVTERVVRRCLAEREQDVWLDSAKTAELIGIEPAALKMRVHRGGELAEMAVMVNGRRRWRRSDVMAWVAQQKGGRREE